MITMKRISAATMLAVAATTFSPDSVALGLGDATVESFLNQPLQLRIDLISRETDDLESVTARLASAQDYELIGANRESVSVPLSFSVEDLEGRPYILATSTLPVGSPVLRLIVEVNWSSGRLLREYTLFLDPPTVPDQAPLPRVDQRAAPRPAVPRPAPEPAVGTTEEPSGATPQARPSAPGAPPAGAEEYGPVRSGDTLWGIASDWSRGSGMNMNQVMIAIQRENPRAFLNDNINLLKRGAILRMPAPAAVEDIPMAEATSEVAAQSEAFNQRRSAGVAASTATPLLSAGSSVPGSAEPEPEVAVEPEVAAEPEPEPAASAVPPEPEPQPADQLDLVPPSADSELDSTYGFEESDDEGADASMAVTALREDLARAEEELVSQQQQNQYLEDRIQELESQLAAQQETGVADADLANMEERQRAERRTRAAAPEEQPWYSRMAFWIIGVLVLAAGFAGWLLSRRGAGDALSGEELKEIKGEAEEVLRVLHEPEDEVPAKTPPEPVEEEAAPPEAQEESETTAAAAAPQVPAGGEVDAQLLDEESSDPEIQLDLARAYVSMGDKEAARVILEEVLANGSEEQRAEARKMLGRMSS